jgi:hypothetical protein
MFVGEKGEGCVGCRDQTTRRSDEGSRRGSRDGMAAGMRAVVDGTLKLAHEERSPRTPRLPGLLHPQFYSHHIIVELQKGHGFPYEGYVFDSRAELLNTKSHPSGVGTRPLTSAHTDHMCTVAAQKSCAVPNPASHVHLSHLSFSNPLDVVYCIALSESGRGCTVERNPAHAVTPPLHYNQTSSNLDFDFSINPI